MKYLLSLILVFGLGFTLISCNNSDSSAVKIEKATDKNGKEYKSSYICPMSCKGSGSDQPGICPACKMNYVASAYKHINNNSSHNHDHSGHDHSGHNHGSVPHDHDGDGKPDH